jgi:hypothetical protein
VASGYRGGIRTRLNYAALPSRNLEVTPLSTTPAGRCRSTALGVEAFRAHLFVSAMGRAFGISRKPG